MKKVKHKSIMALVEATAGPTFRAYYKEMRRHESTLTRIFAQDKEHHHVPEEVGGINQLTPKQARVMTFWRCSICMKDLKQKEVDKLRKSKA